MGAQTGKGGRLSGKAHVLVLAVEGMEASHVMQNRLPELQTLVRHLRLPPGLESLLYGTSLGCMPSDTSSHLHAS